MTWRIFFSFFFYPRTEETFARSLWSKISVANHKDLFLFMSVWYKQEHDKTPCPVPLSMLKKSLCLVLSVMGMRLKFGARPCLFVLCFHFSLMLWSRWSRQAPPSLPITPEEIMSFLIKWWGRLMWISISLHLREMLPLNIRWAASLNWWD